jgi:hypothetical protein
MHHRISVALRGRCHHEFRAAAQRRFERFKRAIGSRAQSRTSVFFSDMADQESAALIN